MSDPGRFHRTVLPSGLTVIGEEMDSVRSLAIGVWLKVGARHETAAEGGMSHFLEHMVFKGSRRRDAYQIALSLESVGGHLDAFTGRESTCFYARALDEHLDLAVDVLADVALAPRLDPADVAKEKQVVAEEIHNYEDTPDDCVHDLFADVVWNGHPLGNRILGTEATVTSFTPEQLRAYHRRHYTAGNLIVAIAGRFAWPRVVDLVARHFDAAPAGPPSATAPLPGKNGGREVVHHVRDLAQQYLCIGAPGVRQEDPDRYALVLLSTVLGGGMSSRLFQRVREQEGLAYSVYTYSDSYEDAGIFCAAMSVHPSQGRKAVRLTLEEFDRIVRDGISPEELQSAKAQLKGNVLLGLESTSNRMHRIARSIIYSGRFLPVDELVRTIDGIAAEDVRDMAARMLDRGRLSLVALGANEHGAFSATDLDGREVA
ncbi:MAG TPA: pitrilysin family protein [Candidatus Limnocylindrales bacterium]|nr:pitrilysin family protein [Candidatus Limnocylindrales bacterium]